MKKVTKVLFVDVNHFKIFITLSLSHFPFIKYSFTQQLNWFD